MPQQGHRAKATHLAVERLLASADLQPPGLPPAAVLIVRRLADPQPGHLAPGLRAARVHADWERAVRQRLAELQRRAARPALGAVWGDAEAVLFADEAELLACLARDIAGGTAGQRWWWQALLRSSWTANGANASREHMAALVRQLTRQAYLAPAVLARLQEWGTAIATLRLLTPAQAHTVLRAMVLARSLSGLFADPPSLMRRPSPPWLLVKPGIGVLPAELGRERDALLGLALDLDARPQVVASIAYQRRFQAWWHAADLTAIQRSGRSPDGARETASSLSDSEQTVGTPVAAASVPPTRAGILPPAPQTGDAAAGKASLAADVRQVSSAGDLMGDTPGPPELRQPFHSAKEAVAGAADHMAPPQTAGIAETETGEVFDPIRTAGDGRPAQGAPPATPDEIEFPPSVTTAAISPLLLAEGVPTRMGGVLYLINLMVALDLPDRFEEGWRLASDVGPWGLLHALGWELLAAEGATSADDPLWPALAYLDDRSADQPPGARLPAHKPRRWPAFELPAAWLREMPAAWAQSPLTSSGRQANEAAGLRERYRPLLARWLVQALPFIGLRLRLALGLSDNAGLAAALLRLPGQLYVTRTHVDLVASLADISLPVRLAGLDRNPGWLPDFARVVTFHFQ